ncbi:hypothetical protein [Robertkochia sediminum]|uniref:hypothetical protein n=1 Tax=Robertkochia sediminum TaxID=2785326 RepID=UPI001932D84B|nr:hypothetical protein [Robertkochia sediminum]MBL7472738.1 hypothetical protein [Robertkochia sediminum]
MKKIFKLSFALLMIAFVGTGQLAANTVEDKVILLNEGGEAKAVAVEADKTYVGQPFFRTENNVVSINMLNMDATPVTVKVYDQFDRVLFDQIITADDSVGKAFDFSNVEDGVYTIVVKKGANKFVKRIEKI